MAAVIGALRAELSASIAKFQEDMGKAAQSVKKFADSAKKQGESLSRVGTKMSIALTAPIVAFSIKAVEAGKESAQALGQVEAALESTGGQSGKTAVELQKSAKALEQLSTFDDDDILKKVTANLLTFGNVQGDVFDRAQKSVVNMAARLGEDLQPAALLVGRALNDPIGAMTRLKRSGIDFTDAQQKLIKSLVQTGQGVKAQGIILDALEKKFGGAAEAARKNDPFAVLNQSIRNLLEAAGPLITGFLVPVTDALKAISDAFVALPGPVQSVIVGVALFAATLGPMIALIGNVIKLIGFLTPLVVGLAAAFAGLSAPIWITAGALTAAVAAVVIFWKSIKDILHGDFSKAWEDAKTTAKGMWDDLTSMFAKKPIIAPIKVEPIGGTKGKGGPLNFSLGPEAQKAADAFAKALRGMNDKIAAAFDTLSEPKSIQKANELNAQIDEYVRTAKEAGVNTATFSGKIAELRKQIDDLTQAGLDKEAQKFARAVDQDAIAVRRFANGSLDPLNEKLATIDEAYDQLKDKIEAEIEDNLKLADANDAAREAMERLQAQLGALEVAHGKASDAAREQWAAEQKIADLQTQMNNARTREDIQDLQRATGNGAPISSHQDKLQSIQRDLDRQRLSAEEKIAELEANRAEAVRVGDEAQAERLDSEIALQQQLHDLVVSTSAEQIEAAQRISDAFRTFTDDLSDKLADMIMDWKGDLDGLRNIFKKLARDLFVKPVTDKLSEGIGGFLKGQAGSLFGGGSAKMGADGNWIPGPEGFVDPNASGGGIFSSIADQFAGLFAGGGFVPPGKWAVAGEQGPEPIFGGRWGKQVVSNADANRGGGGSVVNQSFNISTPDVGGFRRTQRQIARTAKQGLGIG